MVGNGYALCRDWAYEGMAKLYISRDLEVTADQVPSLLSQLTQQTTQVRER